MHFILLPFILLQQLYVLKYPSSNTVGGVFMDNETKQMFELMLKKFDELGNEINNVNTNLKEFQLETQNEIRSLKYQVESNHLETRTELSKIHKKLDTIVNQVAKSAEDITALRLDIDKESLNN